MGKYESFRAMAVGYDWAKSRNKGTDYVSVICGVVDDAGEPKVGADNKQITFEWQGYLTDATTERTVQSLRTFGCTFPGDDITNLTGIDKGIVEIQVEDTDYGKRVAWVNAPRTSSVTDETRLDGAGKKALAARLKGTLLALKGGTSAAKKPASAANPFAVSGGGGEAPDPSNDTSEPLAPTGTDDVPF